MIMTAGSSVFFPSNTKVRLLLSNKYYSRGQTILVRVLEARASIREDYLLVMFDNIFYHFFMTNSFKIV